MAKIHEENIVIKVSKLVKDHAETTPITSKDLIDALTAVTEELAGAGVIVEVETA